MTGLRVARYGPPDRYPPPPPAGLCISVFAVVRQADTVLVGLPAPTDRWFQEWVPAWRAYDQKGQLDSELNAWRLPGAYLKEGEHPDAAIERVLRDQIQATEVRGRKGPRVLSFAAPSDWYRGHDHWDLVFAYELEARVPPALAWWRELRWAPPDTLRPSDFGWGGDLLAELGLARRE